MFKISLCFFTLLVLFFSACAGSPQTGDSSGPDSRNAAYNALSSMERAMAGEPLELPSEAAQSQDPLANGTSPSEPGAVPLQSVSQAAEAADGGGQSKPAWVDSPDTVFSKQRYVSAVGYGSDRRHAERNALANLTGVFGQSVQAELKTVSTYNEAIMSGTIQISGNSSVQDAITTSVEMDSLLGAEIADVWFDSESTYYAAAVMEKEKSAILYADLIRSNERIIADLTLMAEPEKNTLNGYSRYILAAAIADANRVYANVLTLVGNTSGINPGSMKKGDDYRIEAAEIARNIPIAVNVEGDSAGRIRNAFSRSLSAAGFRSGGSGSRYILNVSLTMTGADLPNQRNVFLRYIVDANLTDTADNSVLFPFSFNGREGHINQAEAEELVLRKAESRISGEYEKHLRDYLSVLLPR